MAMQYPLEARIGPPEMLVGCVEELALFHEWIENIPHKLSLSRVILAWYKHGNQPCAMNLQADYGRKKKTIGGGKG